MRIGRRRGCGINALERGNPGKLRAAGMVYWLRFDTGVTLNGSTASAVADRSGNGRTVTQGTAANQPVVTAANAGYRGMPTLDADGSRWMSGAGWTNIPQPTTVIFTAHVTDSAAAYCPFDSQTAYQVVQWLSSVSVQVFAGSAYQPAVAAPTTATVQTAQFAGTSSFFRRAGVQTANGSAGANGNAGLHLFQNNTGASRYKGSMSEIVAFAAALGVSQIRRVEHYMGARYGCVS